ncbi:ABC transporter permease [Kribbella sp. NBC_01245]|uniref:ABC transporter permease n=1 Tax=Kribbella sp. NBC_01245 TaxID=2903578 RepID=UPI002E2B846F|nr:ABC transporter permease [Kribbella sp. NBC_01245]
MSTTIRATYPVPVSDLIPAARKLAADLGETPSRNRLMKELRIGSEKAKAVLSAITAEPHLHAVPNPGTDEPTGPADVDEPEADIEVKPQVTPDAAPVPVTGQAAGTPTVPDAEKSMSSWPVLLLALPAFVAVWSGWVGLGTLTGFGVVHPLPGIADGFSINSAITLPIGVETYAAFALRVWLSGKVPASARKFAKWSALGALVLGAMGQVAFHLLEAAGVTSAPWQITTVVACLPVAVLGMGAALAHLIKVHPSDSGER